MNIKKFLTIIVLLKTLLHSVDLFSQEGLFPINNPPHQYPKITFHGYPQLIEDFQVNENAGPRNADQYVPCIGTDCFGNHVIVWEDKRHGDSQYVGS